MPCFWRELLSLHVVLCAETLLDVPSTLSPFLITLCQAPWTLAWAEGAELQNCSGLLGGKGGLAAARVVFFLNMQKVLYCNLSATFCLSIFTQSAAYKSACQNLLSQSGKKTGACGWGVGSVII